MQHSMLNARRQFPGRKKRECGKSCHATSAASDYVKVLLYFAYLVYSDLAKIWFILFFGSPYVFIFLRVSGKLYSEKS